MRQSFFKLIGAMLLSWGLLGPVDLFAKEDYSALWEELGLAIEEPVALKVNLPATRLDLYIKGEIIKSYGIAIGSNKHKTPIQDFSLYRIDWNPWWYPPKDSEWAKDEEDTPPGPHNPLGVVKMKMQKGIMIHGTSKPWSIGRAASHGCFRMKNYQARELAWELQQRYSGKKDPELLKKYQKNRRRTFPVPLIEPVPVKVEYKQVERLSDRLLLHPNRYWRGGFKRELKAALADQENIVLDKKLIRKLDKLRRRRSTEVSLADIRDWGGASCEVSELGF